MSWKDLTIVVPVFAYVVWVAVRQLRRRSGCASCEKKRPVYGIPENSKRGVSCAVCPVAQNCKLKQLRNEKAH